MCKFENLQMCKWSRKIISVALVFLALSLSVFAQSSDDFWKERKAITGKICRYLEEQKIDSILSSLPEPARNDTAFKSKLVLASTQLQPLKSTTKKLVLREAGNSCAYWYMDGEVPKMLVLVSFDLSGNKCKIESINIFDQKAIQSKELSPFPPPPPPPPPPPRPR